MKYALFCTLLILFSSCPVFAGTIENAPKYEEGVVLVSLNAPIYEEGIAMDVYSKLVLDQAEVFAKKYELEVIKTYPEIARISGKNVIALRSKNKSTDELIKELSSDPDVLSVDPDDIDQPEPNPISKSKTGCNAGYGSILILVAFMLLTIKHERG
jgi:hypothetical protein